MCKTMKQVVVVTMPSLGKRRCSIGGVAHRQRGGARLEGGKGGGIYYNFVNHVRAIAGVEPV